MRLKESTTTFGQEEEGMDFLAAPVKTVEVRTLMNEKG